MINLNSPYFLYMAEADGITSIVQTRTAKINAAVKDFKKSLRNGYNIDDPDIQNKILSKYDLSVDDLTNSERRYIISHVM